MATQTRGRCAPAFLLSSDSDRAVSIHEKENGFWAILAWATTRQAPHCVGGGRRHRPASQPTPACDPEGSELEGWQDDCVQDLNPTPGEPGRGSSGLEQGPPDHHPVFSPRRQRGGGTKRGTWFLKTALILATSPVLPHIQSWPWALRPARASPSLGLNTGGHPRGV